MRINHNISALNTYRQLSVNNSLMAKSLEKLSSGLRINRAGDDAAGLAISEKMRAQIRGLQMASKNAQDGISLIQTAEGALNETHSILQRMRELAVQAANDTNTDIDRAEIQKEINQLTSELNRIANTTEFNTKKLLDGGGAKATDLANYIVTVTEGGKAGNISAVQVLNASKTGKAETRISYTDDTDSDSRTLIIRAKDVGTNLNGWVIKFANLGGSSAVVKTGTTEITIDTNVFDLANSTAQDLENAINQSGLVTDEVEVTLIDPTNGQEVSGSLDAATALAGKSMAPMTGGEASASRGVYAFDVTQAFVKGGDKFTIRIARDGVNGGWSDITLEAGTDFQIGPEADRFDAVTQAQNIANALASMTSVNSVYDVTVNGTSVVLTEKADKVTGVAVEKISVTSNAQQGEFTYTHTPQRVVEAGGKFTIDGVDILVVDNSSGEYTAEINAGRAIEAGGDYISQMTKLAAAINANSQLSVKYSASASNGTLTIKQNAGYETDAPVSMVLWDRAGNGFEAIFQVGANSAQSMTVQINDMRSLALKVSGRTAGGDVVASNGQIAKLTTTRVVTDGTTNEAVEYALDVSSYDKATAAISVINDAIEKVSAERSKLGAYQNRLEHTINNLEVAAENLTAAESRIRDVDMAKEMMEFTKQSILSQAATAMLAQANMQPQMVLQLLGR